MDALTATVLLESVSIELCGLSAMAVGDMGTGQHQFLQKFVVALTIAAGLLVGNTTIRTKASL